MNYRGYTTAEIPAAACDDDALRIMRLYRACWEAMARA